MTELFKDKPSNGNYILIDIIGDVNNPILYPPEKGWAVKDITNIECRMYDVSANMMVIKSACLHESGRLYVRINKNEELWLDEFVTTFK